MTIYFSPTYTSSSYMDLEALSGGIVMDTTVCDLADLVNLIELHSGKYYPERSVYELRVEYMKALKQMDEDNPDNILHKSLEIDAISTAKACLTWREKLVLAGWTSDMMPSPRMQALADAEAYFADVQTLSDRVMLLPDLIRSSNVAADIHLVIPYDHHLMHPAVSAIVDALKAKGAKVEIMKDTHIQKDSNLKRFADWDEGIGDIDTITKPDDTVKVIEFENREKVIEWLATLDKSEHEVWISDHCADIDRAMIANDRPACGSMAEAGLPSTVQIAMLALSLFMSPVDINKLVAWLRLPRSPLPNVRFKLASMVLNEGGYDLNKRKDCLNDYKKNHPETDLQDVENDLNKYLHISDGKDASKKEFTKFIKDLLEWAEGQCASEYVAELHAQYNDLISRLKAILMLADIYRADTIDNATLEKWMMMCSDTCCHPQYAAQKEAHIVISNPGNIIGDAEHVLWCSFSNYTPQCLTYDFLTPTEHNALKKVGCHLYDPDVEVRAIKIQQHWPLHHCKHLTIIEIAEKDKDEVRSMISQQLRVLPRSVWSALLGTTPTSGGIDVVEDANANFTKDMPNEITVKGTGSVTFRSPESYTSLSKLICNPFDYMMEYVLKIKDYTSSISISSGNVAHDVIESIFTPGRDVNDIHEKFDSDFERFFSEALIKRGMILLLPEHKVELVALRNGLKDSIKKLMGIIEDNQLTVLGCEREFTVADFLSPGADVLAKFDMHLLRKDGVQVILDLKWTVNPIKYRTLLEEERAMQLDIYMSVLAVVPHGSREAICGYFVMPAGKLYTYHNFSGENVMVISLANSHIYANAIRKIRNAYSYRRNQLLIGTIEMNHGKSVKDLQYTLDLTGKDLYPISKDDKKYFNHESLLY